MGCLLLFYSYALCNMAKHVNAVFRFRFLIQTMVMYNKSFIHSWGLLRVASLFIMQ